MEKERIFDVHWYGPYSLKKLEGKVGEDKNFALYAVYGTHPLYGQNVLLYIGMTTQSLRERIDQHNSWISEQADPVSVYAAAIAPFETWAAARASDNYPRPHPTDIKAIEALLIFAHQPAYNLMSKKLQPHQEILGYSTRANLVHCCLRLAARTTLTNGGASKASRAGCNPPSVLRLRRCEAKLACVN